MERVTGYVTMAVILAIVAAIFYVFPTQPGIQVSCSQNSILGFKKVPPPLAAISQPEICRVEIIAISESAVLCSARFTVYTTDTQVFPCPTLEKFKNKDIQINAKFFDLNDIQTGTDTKLLTFEGA